MGLMLAWLDADVATHALHMAFASELELEAQRGRRREARLAAEAEGNPHSKPLFAKEQPLRPGEDSEP